MRNIIIIIVIFIITLVRRALRRIVARLKPSIEGHHHHRHLHHHVGETSPTKDSGQIEAIHRMSSSLSSSWSSYWWGESYEGQWPDWSRPSNVRPPTSPYRRRHRLVVNNSKTRRYGMRDHLRLLGIHVTWPLWRGMCEMVSQHKKLCRGKNDQCLVKLCRGKNDQCLVNKMPCEAV